LGKLVEEMTSGSNLSFGLYPGLSHGAYLALKSHGSEALKEIYLPKLGPSELPLSYPCYVIKTRA
jgi:butyryl-CoA dehydrogenase